MIRQALASLLCIATGPITSARFVKLLGAVGGSVDAVVNYNTGQTSLFLTGTMSPCCWNGVSSLTVSTGLIFGLDGTNKGFSGPFKGGNLYVPTPVPGVSGGGSVMSDGKVTVASLGVSGSAVGRFSFGGVGSWTTKPLNVGKFTRYGVLDYLGYLLRRPCN